jgi:hypothetical protein
MSRHELLNLLIMLIVAGASATAQVIPPDRDGLEKGEGMGMGMYGEMNGYPGPLHVLELKDSLHLSAEQLAKTQRIFDEMKQQSVALGRTVITMEEKLNNAFRSGTVSEDSVLVLSTTVGQLRGQLRAVHLRAHLLTRPILSEEQLNTYMRLRGHGEHEHH